MWTLCEIISTTYFSGTKYIIRQWLQSQRTRESRVTSLVPLPAACHRRSFLANIPEHPAELPNLRKQTGHFDSVNLTCEQRDRAGSPSSPAVCTARETSLCRNRFSVPGGRDALGICLFTGMDGRIKKCLLKRVWGPNTGAAESCKGADDAGVRLQARSGHRCGRRVKRSSHYHADTRANNEGSICSCQPLQIWCHLVRWRQQTAASNQMAQAPPACRSSHRLHTHSLSA